VALHVDELLDRLSLALRPGPEGGAEAIGLGVVARVVEARVALTRPGGGPRIHGFEVGDDLLDRSKEAVEVETVKPDLGALVPQLPAEPVVVIAEPADEVEHDRVAPHPGREALEAAQGLLGGSILAAAAHVAVHAVGVGPVAFDGDRAEALVLDEPPGDGRPLFVELVRAVARLADEHVVGVTDDVHQRVVVPCCAGEHAQLRAEAGRRGAATAGTGLGCHGRAAQQFPDLLVGDLGEVPVALTHGPEW
jgi:hypothetical protein